MTFKEFKSALNGDGAEGEIFKTIFVSLIASFAVLLFFYFTRFRYIENFIPKYGFYLFFVVLSYALILPSVRQVRAYKEFLCMSGMMIGMTMGMISGFLIGFYVGATNGMFWGSISGMTIGIAFGFYTGMCCGIMGIMEGMMAGFMGGLMGAMSSVMMINDNLFAASIIILVILAVIIFGLNFMIFKEQKGNSRKQNDSDFFIIFWSVILTAITSWMIIFGPRSVLLQ